MTEMSKSEPPNRRALTRRAQFPNEEIRWWICSCAAYMRERGGYSDGYTSRGTIDTCPFDDRALGWIQGRHGEIERARECRQTWHAIGSEYREVLAAYYVTGERGLLERADGSDQVQDALHASRADAVLRAMQVPKQVATAPGVTLELCGIAMLMWARGCRDVRKLAAASLEALRVAHEIWTIERSQIIRASSVRWKTGTL